MEGESEKVQVFETFPGRTPRNYRVFHNFQGEEGELALQQPVPKPVMVQVCQRYFLGGVGWMVGWGEQPRLQQPVPKPVLKHVFGVHFVF